MLLAKWLRFVVLLADDYLTRLRGWFFLTQSGGERTRNEFTSLKFKTIGMEGTKTDGVPGYESPRMVSNGVCFGGFHVLNLHIPIRYQSRLFPTRFLCESMTKQILHPWSILIPCPFRPMFDRWPDYGSCKLGELCRHAHSKEELRTGEWRGWLAGFGWGPRWRDVNVGRKKHHEYYI